MFAVEGSVKDGQGIGSARPEGSRSGVEFRNVSFAYEGAKEESLKDISFQAAVGQTIGVIGGTGSGKTTLINHDSPVFMSDG